MLADVGLVGFPNAGKSTLLNYLTDAGILSEDKLFATLDPTTRKLELPSGENILLTDTVGFIRKLPHHLIKAFRSTLDEVKYADMLLVVSDVNDPEVKEHIAVTRDVIADLDAADKPTLYVYNKSDAAENNSTGRIADDSVAISALTGAGISDLLTMIEEEIHRSKRSVVLEIPYSDQFVVSSLYSNYTVENVSYLDNFVEVMVKLDAKGLGVFAKYIRP